MFKKDRVIDVKSLNKKREKLMEARKVTIYMNKEYIYSVTK